MARRCDAQTFVGTHVIENYSVEVWAEAGPEHPPLRPYVDDALEPLHNDGVFSRAEAVSAGTAVQGLINAAHEHAADAFLVGRLKPARKETIVRLGRVARRLLRRLPGPTIVVPPDLGVAEFSDGPVILATELRAASRGAARFAKAFSAALDLDLLVTSVATVPEPLARFLAPDRFDTIRERRIKTATSDLQTWIEDHDLTHARTSVVSGSVSASLLDVSKLAGASMLIVGSRGLGTAERVYNSSIGSELAAASPIPVAVVPPRLVALKPLSSGPAGPQNSGARVAGPIAIEELMRRSGVGFGTSGARGLVTAMTDEVCSSYAEGFLAWLRPDRPTDVALAGDLRPSTGRILEAVAAGVARAGHRPVYCGRVPTPALALHAMRRGIPSMMVTGSHIPDDRNGIKFNTPRGEILKGDEAAIRGTIVEPQAERRTLPDVDDAARREYRARFIAAYGGDALAGLRIGVYGHSAVGRDDLVEIVRGLGADATPLRFTDTFEAVDTEAIRPRDVELARGWAGDYDAIVSTDGDSDRPLVSDERGHWLRGDVAGILVARGFAADVVVTPVSSNTAVERSGAFATVVRTKIGSPYVIEAMLARPEATVVGYEANGGFLTSTPVSAPCGSLSALPTRDAVVVVVSLLHRCAAEGRPLSALVADLPRRFTFSGRVRDLPRERSVPRIEALDLAELGEVAHVDRTDGLRLTLGDDTIIHLRPSGNAPELRCYTEADDPDRARALAESMLRRAEAWK